MREVRRQPARPAVLAYVNIVAVMSAILCASLVRGWGAPAPVSVLAFWALHAFAESTSIQFPAGTISAGFLVLMTAAFALPPSSAMVVGFLSAFSWLEWRGNIKHPVRMIFNASQGACYTAAAAVVFLALGGLGGWRSALGAAGAAIVAFGLNTGMVAAVLALEGRRNVLKAWKQMTWSAPNYVGFGILALLVASVYSRSGIAAAVFLITPLLVLRLVHRGFEDEQEAQKRTLSAFARAVELKDPYTRGHSDRVADIAVELFREMGEDGDELSGRYYGALLHDLGKIAVPARILTKPGALSDDEWTIVREHPVIGAAVAKEIDFLEEQIPMMLFHHERIDGRGYPWGLGAEAIPLAARVLSVSDVFDTLTSDRPYRRALSTDDAMIEIELSAGTQLDADVVAALRRVLKRTEFPARLSPDLPVAEPVAEPLAQGA